MRKILITFAILLTIQLNAGFWKSAGKAISGTAALGVSAAGAAVEYAAGKEEWCLLALNTFNQNYTIVISNINNNAYTNSSIVRKQETQLINQGKELIKECSFVQLEGGEIMRQYVNRILETNLDVEESTSSSMLSSATDMVNNTANNVKNNYQQTAATKTSNYIAKRPSWCNKAKSSTEKAICNNDDIGALDIELSQNYKIYKEILSDTDGKILKKTQRAWLKKRNRCKGNHTCLLREYTSRNDELIQLFLEFNAASRIAAHEGNQNYTEEEPSLEEYQEVVQKNGKTINNMEVYEAEGMVYVTIKGKRETCDLMPGIGKIDKGDCVAFKNSKGVQVFCTPRKKNV